MLQISNLQISKPVPINGSVGLPNLTALGMVNPQLSSRIAEYIYAIKSQINPSDNFIKNFTKKTIVKGSTDYEWSLGVPNARTIPLIECRIANTAIVSTDAAGAGGATFDLVFGEKYFYDTDVLASEAGPAYQILVISDPKPEGTNWVYKCQLASQINKDTYIPYEYLTGGRSFSRNYAPTERSMGSKGAGFNYSTSLKMRNQFMKLRYEDMIPGDVIDNGKMVVFSFNITTPDGKSTPYQTWESFAEYERKLQIQQHMNRAIWTSRYNKDDKGNIVDIGKNNVVKPMISGIEEQMYSGQKRRFIVPTLAMFEEAIYAVSDKTDFTSSSEIMMRTGKWGALYFRKLIQDKASAFQPLLGSQFATKDKDNGFALDTVFSAYKLANGAILRVFVDSTLDDKSVAYNMLPMGNGLPGNAFSYIYNIVNIGTEGGESNIEVIYKDTDMYQYYVRPGVVMANKYYNGANNLAVIKEHAVEVDYMTPEFTVALHDPSRCVSFIPSQINI